MKITREMLDGLKEYQEFHAWFLHKFPAGEAGYRDAMIAACDEGCTGSVVAVLAAIGEAFGVLKEVK